MWWFRLHRNTPRTVSNFCERQTRKTSSSLPHRRAPSQSRATRAFHPFSYSQYRDYFTESALVRDFHTSWWSIWNGTSESSCNLFILYILRFSHPQKYILALGKFELRVTCVHPIFSCQSCRQSYSRWPRKTPRKHNTLKPFVIGRNDFFTCAKLVAPLWLVEVKSETLFHTAKFDVKI